MSATICDITPDLYNGLVTLLETQREEALSLLKEQGRLSPQVTGEMVNQLMRVAAAESSLASLEKNFTLNGG